MRKIGRKARILFVAFLALGSLGGGPIQAQSAADTCANLLQPAKDSTAVLQACLDAQPAGGAVQLDPKTYVLTHPLIIRKSVSIGTRGVAADASRCDAGGEGFCATLLLRMEPGSGGHPPDRVASPIMVTASDVHIDHLVVRGGMTAPADPNRAARCAGDERPLGGGLSVRASGFAMSKSMIEHVECFSAITVDAGTSGLLFTDNILYENGTHTADKGWADGLTVDAGRNHVIRHNTFRDNTDVQLILGGCLNCQIDHNELTHSTAKSGASFADLLIHSWPGRDGNYEGTTVSDNRIDCGDGHNCGFGLGIGANAWYPTPAKGGRVLNNQIRNAQVGLNIDDASGPIDVRDNIVEASGGAYPSDCGVRQVGAVNISSASRQFVDVSHIANVDPASITSLTFAKCLINRPQK